MTAVLHPALPAPAIAGTLATTSPTPAVQTASALATTTAVAAPAADAFASGHRDPFARIGPNWFASVMGTGIVAVAAATLPWQPPGLRTFSLAVWMLDVVLLVLVVAAAAVHWRRHPGVARGYLDDPVMSHSYGAPAMALMTVGAGTLLVGRDVVGLQVALVTAAVLWVAGTSFGLFTAVAVPYRAFTTHAVEPDSAFGGWLMPVVPPMVSAATGAAFLPHLPAGQWRLNLFVGCYAMFGLTLLVSLMITTMVWSRLVHHKVGPAAAVPTLWIVLGFLGQSVTAAGNLGTQAHLALPAPYGTAFRAFGVVYGVPVWGFAMLWSALAIALTVRTARVGLPFSLTWWSFTFPVGTVVTGTSSLAAHTGSHLLAGAAVTFFLALLTAWVTVAVRTYRGVRSGTLL